MIWYNDKHKSNQKEDLLYSVQTAVQLLSASALRKQFKIIYVMHAKKLCIF